MNTQNCSQLSHDALERFTATGQPFKPHSTANSHAIAMTTSDTLGHGPPNLLPLRYTDDSIISVPVLPATTHDSKNSSQPLSDTDTDTDRQHQNTATDASKKPSPFSTFIRRLSSSSKPKYPAFVMRDMSRGEYLSFYAKDAGGRYCGSETPAVDCILTHEEDRAKYRGGGPGGKT